MAFPRFLLLVGLLLSAMPQAGADDRADALEKLLADFETVQAEFHARDVPPSPTERIGWYKSYPRWIYLPRIVALAEANPGDATALAASKWIVEQPMGPSWKPIFDAEQTAWRIIKEQQLTEEECSRLCLLAAGRQSPTREAFLRDMASRTDLPGNAQAFAALALAEYLAQRSEEAEAGGYAAWPKPEDEHAEFLRTQLAEEWIAYATVADPESFRRESSELFRRVLAEYADVPVTITAPGFRDLKTIGDKARKSLHALEHLYVGAPAPDFDVRDLDGNALRLADYRGKVVLLSFWFTGCGPCIAMVPKEQELLEKFRDRPFALVGVCRDADVATSKKTAAEHGMTWPSVHDGSPGKVTDAYNVLSWPSLYLIDAEGKIALKNATWEDVEGEVESLMAMAADAKAAQPAP